MKKKKFYFNDGLDGIVLAKSRKQAIGIVAKVYKVPKSNIRNFDKKALKNPCFYLGPWFTSWYIDGGYATKRKGRSRIIG